MGQHPNGQHGAQFQPQPWPAYPPPGSNGSFNFAKGYLPLAIVIPTIFGLVIAAFQVGSIYTKQQATIESVQTDVSTVKQDVREIRQNQIKVETKIGEIGAAVQKIADNPPWHVQVKAATKR